MGAPTRIWDAIRGVDAGAGAGAEKKLWEMQMQRGFASVKQGSTAGGPICFTQCFSGSCEPRRERGDVDQLGVVLLLLLAQCQQRIAGKCQQLFQLNGQWQHGSVVCLEEQAAGRVVVVCRCAGGWDAVRGRAPRLKRRIAAKCMQLGTAPVMAGGSLALHRPGIAGPGLEAGVPVT